MVCKCAAVDYAPEQECPLSRSVGSIATAESLQESRMLEHWMPLHSMVAVEARELLDYARKGLAWQDGNGLGLVRTSRLTRRGAAEKTNEAGRASCVRVRPSCAGRPSCARRGGTTNPTNKRSALVLRNEQTSVSDSPTSRVNLSLAKSPWRAPIRCKLRNAAGRPPQARFPRYRTESGERPIV
jgi:hypothetical protein